MLVAMRNFKIPYSPSYVLKFGKIGISMHQTAVFDDSNVIYTTNFRFFHFITSSRICNLLNWSQLHPLKILWACQIACSFRVMFSWPSRETRYMYVSSCLRPNCIYLDLNWKHRTWELIQRFCSRTMSIHWPTQGSLFSPQNPWISPRTWFPGEKIWSIGFESSFLNGVLSEKTMISNIGLSWKFKRSFFSSSLSNLI